MGRSKKSSKRASRRPRRPAFAIVLLVLFMATVFWFIVQRQLGSAEARRLRLLAGFADRVEATVGDLGDRFGRVVTERCAAQVADYLNLLPQVEYVSSTPIRVPCRHQEQTELEPADSEAGEEERPPAGVQEETATEQLPEEEVEGSMPPVEPEPEIQPKLTLVSTGPHVRLEYQRNGPSGSEMPAESREGENQGLVKARSARARLDLESVIAPMIIPGIFDSILLADAEGKVLHQQGEPELRVMHLDGLLGAFAERGERRPEEIGAIPTLVESQGGETTQYLLRLLRPEGDRAPPAPANGRATTILETSIADSDHSVFLQPVKIWLSPLRDLPAPEPVQWIAVGVISREHLLSAGVTTSPILLFLLVSILPLGLVIWPFLKLALISRRQPFTRLDCAFLVLACVLALTFGALLVFDGLFVSNIQNTVDRQLARLSDTVHQSFRLEVYDAYRQLDRLNRSVGFWESDGTPELAGNSGSFEYFEYLEGGSEEGSATRTARTFIESRIGDFLEFAPPRIYPYFDSVFWPDSEGRLEGANLPLREHAVLPQEVSDRDYFRCADEWENPLSFTPSERELERYWATRHVPATGPLGFWRSGIPVGEPCRDCTIKLCLEPFLDRTTGEAVAAVSIRSPEDWRMARPVAALVTQFTSMIHPVLPPEIRFAVVDEQGQVLFHSDSRRALTEDFLKATDENRLLQSLVNTQREGHLPLHYWGQRHRAYVRPMEGLPWTLIVFRSMEDLRLRNFELIYDFLNPYVLSLCVLGLLVLVFAVKWPRKFRIALWPTPRHLRAYKWIIGWTLAMLAMFVVLMVSAPWSRAWLFVASFSLLPATVVFVVVMGVLRHRKREAPTEKWFPEWYANLKNRSQELWGRTSERIHSMIPRRVRSGESAPDGEEPAGFSTADDRESPPGTIAPVSPAQTRGGNEQRTSAAEWEPQQEDDESGKGESSPPGGMDEDSERKSLYRRLHEWIDSYKRGLGLSAILLSVVAVAGLIARAYLMSDLMAGWLALILIVVAATVWWLSFEFDGQRRRIAYRFALGCLLLLCLLPALGFFHLARSRQIQFITQEATLALAGSARDRIKEIENRQGPLKYYGSYLEALACARDSYMRAVFEAKPAIPPESSRDEEDGWVTCPITDYLDLPEGDGRGGLWPFGWERKLAAAGGGTGTAPDSENSPDWLEGLMVRTFSARPLALNDLSTRPSGLDLSRFHSTRGTWSGVEMAPRQTVVALDLRGAGEEHLPALASTVPGLGSLLDLEVRRAFLLGLGLVSLGAAPFFMAWFVSERLLLISLVYYGEGWVKPGEALEDALDEVGTAHEPIKRLVLVAGQLRREAWQDKVAGDGETKQEKTDTSGVFCEARFREAWKQAEGAGSVEDPRDGDQQPELILPKGLGTTGSRISAPTSRAARFEVALIEGAGEGQPILVTEFDPDLRDPAAATDQTDALRDLIEHAGRSVVILSETVPFHDAEDSPDTPEAEAAEDRWIEFLGSFPVCYARDMKRAGRFGNRLTILKRRLDIAHTRDKKRLEKHEGDGDKQEATERRRKRYEEKHWRSIWRRILEECRHTPALQQLGEQLVGELFSDLTMERLEEDIRSRSNEIDRLKERIEDPSLIFEDKIEKAESLDKLQPLEAAVQNLKKQTQAAHEDPPKRTPAEASSGPPLMDQQRIDSIKKKLEARREALQENETRQGGQEKGAHEQLVRGPKSGIPKAHEQFDLGLELERIRKEKESEEQTLTDREKRLAQLQEVRGSYRTLLTEDHVITRVGAEARLQYRHLWAQCTRDEKLVLVQLAHHGQVNPKYSGWVLDLMQKGLVLRDPDVRIMNRSFERFVKQETRRSQILEWQDELGPNAWGLLKWILPFPLLALAGFLFITQRDAVSNAAGVLVALVSLTPVVFNLYDKFQEINLRQSRADADEDEDEG